MRKLTSNEAYKLLIKDVIHDENDINKSENRWILHCVFAGLAAERIASKLNLDSDYAKALGIIHDIGRKISHPKHTIEGYNYMLQQGYPEEAKVCLTHSFIDNDIMMTAGGGPNKQHTYDYVNNFLIQNPVTIYDNIIQMTDLFCLETGFTTIENRLLDISKRKGVYPNSLDHFHKTMELKERLEEMLGCSLYSLFPEIKQEELNNIDKDHEELMELVKHPTKQLIRS